MVFGLAILLFAPILQQLSKLIFEKAGGKALEAEVAQLSQLQENRRGFVHEIVELHEEALGAKDAKDLADLKRSCYRKTADSLLLAFRTISADAADMSVQIFAVKDGVIQEAICRSPSHFVSHTEIETLQNENSFAMRAIKSQDIEILADIKRELSLGEARSRFLVSLKSPDRGSGSLICFPVQRRRNKEVIALVSIHSSTAYAFLPKNRDFYRRELELYEADLVFGAIFEKAHEAMEPPAVDKPPKRRNRTSGAARAGSTPPRNQGAGRKKSNQSPESDPPSPS